MSENEYRTKQNQGVRMKKLLLITLTFILTAILKLFPFGIM